MKYPIFSVNIVFLLYSSTASAYIGPGMAGGVLAAIIGVISAIFLGLFGILYYPIKRSLKKRKSKQETNKKEENPDRDDP